MYHPRKNKKKDQSVKCCPHCSGQGAFHYYAPTTEIELLTNQVRGTIHNCNLCIGKGYVNHDLYKAYMQGE
jgi:DnaJ-class molecular chaperone